MGTGVDREWEAAHGLTAPPCFALAAQAHMANHGTTEEQMALVSVKNHNHAAKNPYAPLQKGATLDQVLCSADDREPVSPLHVLADHRRRRRRDRRQRGARPRPDRPARVDPGHRARRWTGSRSPRCPRTTRAGRPCGGRRSTRIGMAGIGPDRRRPRGGPRLLRDRRDHRVRGARVLREGRRRAVRREGACPTTAGRSSSTRAAGSSAAATRSVRPASPRPARPSGSFATRPAPARSPAPSLALTHNNSGMGEHVVMIYGRAGRLTRREASQLGPPFRRERTGAR